DFGSEERRPSRHQWVLLVVMGLVVLATFWPHLEESGAMNLYVHLADAMVHGRLDISEHLHDVVMVGDKIYVPFPPFPAVILIALLGFLGLAAATPAYLSPVLTLVGAVALRATLRRLGIEQNSTYWLLAAFFLGTAYWLCAICSSGVWAFAHVVATVSLLLAIGEALGPGRGAMVGLLLGMAFLSRQMTVYASVFLAAALWRREEATTRTKLINLSLFTTAFGVCVLIYLWYNW